MRVFTRDTSVSPQKPTEMDEEVNTDDFIAAVEQFPAIWDTSSNNYSNKITKKNSWELLIVKFCPNFAERTNVEKANIGEFLLKHVIYYIYSYFTFFLKRKHNNMLN